MSGAAQLPELHLEILKLIWLEWNSNRAGERLVDGGLTRDEIFASLSGKLHSNWNSKPRPGDANSAVLPPAPPLINAAVTLKRHLHQLCAGEPQYLITRKVPDRRGSPFVYKINDVSVVTWPSTAFLLTEVWKAKHIGKDVLVEAMLAQDGVAFLDKPAAREQVIREIERQINWCLAQKYLEYVEEHEESDYRPADRLHYECRFLEYVARKVRA